MSVNPVTVTNTDANIGSSAERQALLEMRAVTTHYGPIRVLNEVDMTIYPGEMVCLLGGNASGKSTTLKTILGLVGVSSGEMYLSGERLDTLTTAERIDLLRGGQIGPAHLHRPNARKKRAAKA